MFSLKTAISKTPLMKTIPITMVVFGGLVLSACTAKDHAILNSKNVGTNLEDVHVFTGARQRLISNHLPKLTTRPGLVDPHRIVCAEPSPDVAISVANSLSAGLGVTGYGSASLAAQSAEGLAQLAEKTVSIQLMQMLMYRTCEAYSNGAIPGTVYNSKMDRLFQTMVTLSLAETAGGNFGRSLAGGSGKTSGEASASATGLPNVFEGVEDSIAKLAAAEEKVQKAEGELASAKEAQANIKNDASPEEKSAAEKAVEDSQASHDKAIGERNALRGALRSEVQSAAKATAANTVVGGGSIAVKPDSKIAAILEKMQANYLDQRPILSYVDACIAELSLGSGELSDTAIKSEILGNLKSVSLKRNKGGDALKTDDLKPIARFMWSGRKSGLFENCKTNLPIMIALDARQQSALGGYEAETARMELVVREKEANVKISSTIVSALKACEKLGGEVAQICIANVMHLGKTETPVTNRTYQELLEKIPAGFVQTILPIIPFEKTKETNAQLVAKVATLKSSNIPDAHSNFSEAKHKKLTEDVGKALAIADKVIAGNNIALTNGEKTRLESIQNNRAQILTEIGLAGDDVNLRKVREAKLKAHQGLAEYENNRLVLMLDKTKASLASVETSLSKIEAAKPKAQTGS